MQGSLCVIEGGGEWCQWFGIERDVEMNTPFGRGGGLGELGKVFKPSERVRVEDHLVQVCRFVELLNGGEGLFVLRVEGEGVGEVDFGNTKPGLGEGVERLMAVVEFEGEMTGVVVDADVFANGGGIDIFFIGPSKKPFEKGEGFFGVFKMSERFRFQSEMEILAGLHREVLDGESEGVEVFKNQFFVGFKFLEGTRKSGNGSAGFFRAKTSDDGEELFRVDEAGELGPVGLVDLFFDAGAVEGAVGKAIDSEDVAVFRFKPGRKFVEAILFEKFLGRLRGEAETNREFFIAGDAVADCEDVGFENVKCFGPSFRWMNVCAVGEMLVLGKLHGIGRVLAGVWSGTVNWKRTE